MVYTQIRDADETTAEPILLVNGVASRVYVTPFPRRIGASTLFVRRPICVKETNEKLPYVGTQCRVQKVRSIAA